MIASLSGILETLGGDWVIINVGGVGFQVHTSTTTRSSLGKAGEEVRLYTHFLVRDDGATLYGFAVMEELQLFQILIGVSGLGPRLALAMLSAMEVDKLAMAIATGSTELLTSIPGIGKKMASRLVLELKDKVGAGFIATPIIQVAQENTDVVSALLTLGYSVTEASQAIASLPVSTDLGLEDKIRLALQYFGTK